MFIKSVNNISIIFTITFFKYYILKTFVIKTVYYIL